MTSSIYPILASLSTPIIDTPGSGYTSTPTVTIDTPPSGGTPATGIAFLNDGVIDVITVIGGTNSGYTDGEAITLSGGTGGNAKATATISLGVVSNILFTNRGDGFTASDVITITGEVSTINTATFTVSTIADNAVSNIGLTNGGTGYKDDPDITITGGGGTGATATSVFNIKSVSIFADTDILNSDIVITPDMVSPGGGGVLRLYFSFDAGAATEVRVFNNGALKGILNTDNSNEINVDGYYRFDLDVESGDNINLQSSLIVTTVNFLRAHLIQFGA